MRPTPSTCVSAKREPRRRAYDGVVLAAPVTVPYVRYSIRAAHWWLARAFSELLKKSDLDKGGHRRPDRLELHARARHRDRPDAAPRPLAALARSRPAGRRERRGRAAARGARGASRRRRHRRVHRRRHQPRRLVSPHAGELQPVRARRGLSLRRRRPERQLRFPHRPLHARARRDARGLRQAVRRAARQRAQVSSCAVQEASDAWRSTSRRARSPSRCTSSTA